MQFTPGIKQYPAVRTTALTLLLSGQQPLTVTTEHRIFLFSACGGKSMVFHLIMAGKAGIIFPAHGAFKSHHIAVLMIVRAPALFIKADTINLNSCMHISLSSYLQHIFYSS